MSRKPGVIIMGKLPPPYFGPAIATQILLQSDLNNDFELVHIDTRLNAEVAHFGKWRWQKLFRFWGILFRLFRACIRRNNRILLIPIAQTTGALLKDSAFIWLGWLCGKKVLIQLRGSDLLNWYSKQKGFKRWYFRITFRRSTAGLVLGEKLREQFALFLAADQIHVLPNGANYPEAPQEPSVKSEFKLLYFSNFLPGKGFDLVLEALSLLSPDEKAQLSLDAVGSWDNANYQARCEKLIADGALPVRLHAPVSGAAKWQFFREASALVFTPRHPEGHPWVTIEALAFGLPVIATNQGAITESVLSDKNGFVLDNQHPEEIAAKIGYLLQHPEKRLQMSREARRFYAAHLTEKHMTERYKNLFYNLLRT